MTPIWVVRATGGSSSRLSSSPNRTVQFALAAASLVAGLPLVPWAGIRKRVSALGIYPGRPRAERVLALRYETDGRSWWQNGTGFRGLRVGTTGDPYHVFATGSRVGRPSPSLGAPSRLGASEAGFPILKHRPGFAADWLWNPLCAKGFMMGRCGTDLAWCERNAYPRNDLSQAMVIVGPGRWNRKHSVEEERTDDAEERA